MDFNEYQKRTLDTLITEHTNDLLKNNKDLLIARLALGIAGESGEIAEKVKKYLRGDYNGHRQNDKIKWYNPFCHVKKRKAETSLKVHLKKEIGDVLWYCATLAHVMDLDLGEIAKLNIEKLKDRKERGKVKGSGDNR